MASTTNKFRVVYRRGSACVARPKNAETAKAVDTAQPFSHSVTAVSAAASVGDKRLPPATIALTQGSQAPPATIAPPFKTREAMSWAFLRSQNVISFWDRKKVCRTDNTNPKAYIVYAER